MKIIINDAAAKESINKKEYGIKKI